MRNVSACSSTSSVAPQAALVTMALSKFGAATRALVAVLLLLARSYNLLLDVNRDSSAEQLLKAYRKVLLKAHPDKGGKQELAQKLQAAKENWDKARNNMDGDTTPQIALSCDKSSFKIWATQNSPPPLFRFLA